MATKRTSETEYNSKVVLADPERFIATKRTSELGCGYRAMVPDAMKDEAHKSVREYYDSLGKYEEPFFYLFWWFIRVTGYALILFSIVLILASIQ